MKTLATTLLASTSLVLALSASAAEVDPVQTKLEAAMKADLRSDAEKSGTPIASRWRPWLF